MVLAVLAGRVVTGDLSAPTLVALVVAAGLVGLLVSGRPAATPSGASGLPLIAALVLVLAANLVALGDLARLLGLPGVHGIAAGGVLALGAASVSVGDRWWRLTTPIGAALVVLPLVLVVAWAGAPWTAWKTVASRTALTFTDGSPWVTQGRPLGDHARLTFLEPHRVIAGTPATWRVIERDAARIAVREWQLGVGDGLTLRPGDELAVEADARLRFQAGRRIPGAPPSGMQWADGRPRAVRETMIATAGAAVTLVGGGLALTPMLPLAGVLAIIMPTMLFSFAVGAAVWGVYGMAIAPELSLVPRSFAPLLEVLARLATAEWRGMLVALVVTGVIALFVGVSLAWRTRMASLVTEVAAMFHKPAPSPVARLAFTAIVVGLATVVAARGRDPWALFVCGLGLAAAAVAAPRLASGGPRGDVAGAIVGSVAFTAIVVGAAHLPPEAAALADYPALAAAPLAWLTARFVGEL